MVNHQNIIDISLKNKDISLINSECVVKESIIKNTPGVLLIHAHWCGHCTRFLPTYKKIAQMLNTPDQLNVPLLALESDQLTDKDVVSKLNFAGFPTIKFFDQRGVIMDDDYNGKREINDILKEICNRYHKCYQH